MCAGVATVLTITAITVMVKKCVRIRISSLRQELSGINKTAVSRTAVYLWTASLREQWQGRAAG